MSWTVNRFRLDIGDQKAIIKYLLAGVASWALGKYLHSGYVDAFTFCTLMLWVVVKSESR